MTGLEQDFLELEIVTVRGRRACAPTSLQGGMSDPAEIARPGGGWATLQNDKGVNLGWV